MFNVKTVLKILIFSFIGITALWTLEFEYLEQPIRQQEKKVIALEKMEQELIDSLKEAKMKKESQSLKLESMEKMATRNIEDTNSQEIIDAKVKPQENQIIYIREKDDGMNTKELITWIVSLINGLILAVVSIKQLFFKKST